MSFTTRCPACGTMFRVVADQLKISDGWVRCGHCSDVFDATIHLEAWVPPHPSRPGPTASPASPRAEEAIETQAPEGEPDPWFGDAPAPEPLPEAVPPAPPAAVAATPAERDAAPVVDPDFQAELQQFASVQARSSAPAPLVDVPALVAPSAAGSADAVADAATSRAEPATAEAAMPADVPGFVRQARRRAFWSSPGVRAALGLLTVLLALLLAGQWVLQERHRLVVSQPALKPWIVQACEVLGCRIEPLRRIDAVVIDSSELVRRLGNFYSFDLVVRNTATIEVAVPALELSLTDANDAVIARRVFLPQEWPDAPASLPAQGNLTVSFRLSLTLGESAPMAGYRALVFYP